jgi:hypothetical protein
MQIIKKVLRRIGVLGTPETEDQNDMRMLSDISVIPCNVEPPPAGFQPYRFLISFLTANTPVNGRRLVQTRYSVPFRMSAGQ